MAIKETIPELTDNKYSELRYNSAGTVITGTFMKQVYDLLSKASINVNYSGSYDDSAERAVSEFQKKAGLSPTGILSTETWQAMIAYADKMPNSITAQEGSDTETTSGSETGSPHYNSFFDDDKNKTHRRNHKDIVIQFGNKTITKTIKDVYMRSVTVEVDTSGNPIFEIYEFIGRDIKESDEGSDAAKYTSENEPTSSSDIKYNFNFKFEEPKASSTPAPGGGGGGVSSW